jgi:hypothetical protein
MVFMTIMVVIVRRMPMMMVVAVPMIVLMRTMIVLMRAIIGLERRRHLDAGKSMLREERLDLGPLLQPDAVG